jgi:hypothetical protein
MLQELVHITTIYVAGGVQLFHTRKQTCLISLICQVGINTNMYKILDIHQGKRVRVCNVYYRRKRDMRDVIFTHMEAYAFYLSYIQCTHL